MNRVEWMIRPALIVSAWGLCIVLAWVFYGHQWAVAIRTQSSALLVLPTEELEPGTYQTIGSLNDHVQDTRRTKVIFVRREVTHDVFLVESSALPERFVVRQGQPNTVQAISAAHPSY
jgi:hypothetical protein